MAGRRLSELEALVRGYAFHPRRQYRVLGLDVSPQFHADQLAILEDPDRRVVIERDGRIVAAVGYTPRDFEGGIIGAPSVALTPVYTAEGLDRPALVFEAFEAVLELLAERGIPLVVAHIDTDDVASLLAAQDAGFRVLDTSTSWIIVPGEQVTDFDIDDGYRIELLDADQGAALPEAAVARILAEAGRAFPDTHLHRDPRIDNRLADEVYRQWGENTLRGHWYDHIITVWRDDEVAGILGWRLKELDAVDGKVRVLTDSFGWRLPDAPGVGKAFHRCVVGGLDGDVIEGVTQITNALIYVLARGGHFRAILSHYVMHAWTD